MSVTVTDYIQLKELLTELKHCFFSTFYPYASVLSVTT